MAKKYVADLTGFRAQDARKPGAFLETALASSATGGASPISMCVRKNASQPANVRAFGACAAAGCNPPQKAALPLFLKLIAMV